MKKAIGIIILGLLLTSCSTSKVMNNVMTSWKGSHISEVIDQWGYPSAQQDIAGRKLYIWVESVSGITTGTITGDTISMMGGAWTCKRILEVNDEEKVISWQWSGNNCPFGLTGRYKNWPKKLSN